MKLTIHAGAGLAAIMLLAACDSEGESVKPNMGEVSAGAAEKAPDDNPLTTWCMETETQETCECADAALRGASIESEYAIYQSLAPTYLLRRAAGDDYVTAFDAASEETAERLGMTAGELRQITNRMGRQHRDAIKQCEN